MRFNNTKDTCEGGLVIREPGIDGAEYVVVLYTWRDGNMSSINAYLSREDAIALAKELLRLANG